jgi:hypothetical protein
MKAVLTGVCSCILFTTYPSLPCHIQDGNDLVCSQPIVDKGRCKAGVVLSHTFELKNVSQELLVIRRVDSACGCIKLAVGSQELRGGEKTVLTVEISTLTQPDGPQRWSIRLYYQPLSEAKAAQEHMLELAIQAHIVREVDIQPSRLVISTRGATKHTITITDRRPKTFTIRQISSVSPFVTVTIQKHAQSRYEIMLQVHDHLPDGEHDGSVSIWTDDAEYREIRIPVLILRQPNKQVAWTPDEVIFHLQPGQPSSQLVQIRSLTTEPVRLVSAVSDHPAVQVKFPQESSRITAVRISLSPASVSTSGTALVRLQLSEPRPETLSIPVRWILHTTGR